MVVTAVPWSLWGIAHGRGTCLPVGWRVGCPSRDLNTKSHRVWLSVFWLSPQAEVGRGLDYSLPSSLTAVRVCVGRGQRKNTVLQPQAGGTSPDLARLKVKRATFSGHLRTSSW